jgi:hypothetical protein
MAKVTWMRQNGVIKATWRSELGHQEVLDSAELTDAPNWRTAPEPKHDTTVSDPLLGDDAQPPAQEQPSRTQPRATSRLIPRASQPE